MRRNSRLSVLLLLCGLPLAGSAQPAGQKPPCGFRAASPTDYRSDTEFRRTTRLKDIKVR